MSDAPELAQESTATASPQEAVRRNLRPLTEQERKLIVPLILRANDLERQRSELLGLIRAAIDATAGEDVKLDVDELVYFRMVQPTRTERRAAARKTRTRKGG